MEKISSNTNSLNWFEIPILDTARAKKFYETIFDIEMGSFEIMGMEMVNFPQASEDAPNGKVSGALVKSPMHKPSTDGCIIYLNANPTIQTVIERIEKAGGKIVMPKTLINEQIGYMAFFIDTEGNKMGLHAAQ